MFRKNSDFIPRTYSIKGYKKRSLRGVNIFVTLLKYAVFMAATLFVVMYFFV